MTTKSRTVKERGSLQNLSQSVSQNLRSAAQEQQRSPSPDPGSKKKSKSSKTSAKVNQVAAAAQSKDYDIFNLPSSDWTLVLTVTAIAFFVRLFRIHQPTSVVFDEVHFGGFATKYIKGKFFMDVHPPLAKLLITLAGWLAGFDGSFDFKEIGKDYLAPGVPYVAMRLLPAIMGVLVVPTMFLTLKASGCSSLAATLGALFITFENGLITQSRLILLDSPLVIFTALTALSWTSFMNQHALGPSAWFSTNWWFWLVSTGFSLGATVSVKWVGLFTIGWVGGITIIQLWTLLADTQNVPVQKYVKHVMARAFCLIVIPVSFYMFMFYIHLLCLVNPGDGDGFMSAEFQSTLNSKSMAAVPADVAFGSKISLRHWNTQGGYLHSHNHMYPAGSKQQQITLYPHKDDNNVWVVENQTAPEGGVGYGGFDAISPPIHLKDGDTIKLYHTPTHRRLHSHDVRPPVSEADWQNEVSAYGYQGFEGDANDYFRVEIVKSMSNGAIAKSRVRTIDTKFRLVHTMTGCVLFSHKVKLPAWGYEQQEVTCAKQGTLPNSIWYIESNDHPQLVGPDVEKVNYRNPGFFGKFIELQKVMWRTNAGLVESHAWDSRPPSWPILKRGINFWGKNNRQIYLIGNPVIWWSSTLAIVAYVVFKGIATLRWQRGFNDYNMENFRRFDFEVGATVLGWAFHYFPFFLMQRQLFLHHYFPALFFAIIALCQGWDFIFARIQLFGLRNKPSIGLLATTVYLAISIIVFYLYSPLTYGNMWTRSDCTKVKIFDKWDWDCNNFHDSYAKYSNEHLLGDAQPTGGSTAQVVKPAGGAPEAPQAPAQSAKADIKDAQAPVAAPIGGSIIKREERVEYRDQNGNLIPEDQIKELEGKVEFQTRYETRTRLVDAAGNEISPEQAEQEQFVEDAGDDDTTPEHAEAVESETEGAPAVEDNQTVPEQASVDINTKSRRFEQPAAAAPESAVEIETDSIADAPSSKSTKTVIRRAGSSVSSASSAAASVAGAGSSSASSVVDAAASSASSAASVGSSSASSVASSASDAIKSSVQSGSSVAGSVADAGKSSVVSAASAASSAGSSVVDSVSSAGTVVASSAASAADYASASVKSAASDASSAGSSIVGGAAASIKSAASAASSVGASVVDNASTNVRSVASDASSVGSSVASGASASAQSAASGASSVGASVVDSVSSAGTVVASSAASVAGNASASVKSAVSGASSAGSSVVSGASDSASSVASSASSIGSSVVSGASASAQSAAAGASSAGSSVVGDASASMESVASVASSATDSIAEELNTPVTKTETKTETRTRSTETVIRVKEDL